MRTAAPEGGSLAQLQSLLPAGDQPSKTNLPRPDGRTAAIPSIGRNGRTALACSGTTSSATKASPEGAPTGSWLESAHTASRAWAGKPHCRCLAKEPADICDRSYSVPSSGVNEPLNAHDGRTAGGIVAVSTKAILSHEVDFGRCESKNACQHEQCRAPCRTIAHSRTLRGQFEESTPPPSRRRPSPARTKDGRCTREGVPNPRQLPLFGQLHQPSFERNATVFFRSSLTCDTPAFGVQAAGPLWGLR